MVCKAVLRAKSHTRREPCQQTWGYESVGGSDWRKLIDAKETSTSSTSPVPNLITHALRWSIAAAQARRSNSFVKSRWVEMSPSQRPWWRGPEKSLRAQHGLVQPSPRARRHLAKELVSEGRLGPGSSPTCAGFLQDWTISVGSAPGRVKVYGAWIFDAVGSGVHRATCSPTALIRRFWLTGSIDSVSAVAETFIKERKHTLTGKVHEGWNRRREVRFWRASPTVRWGFLYYPLCPRTQRLSTPLRNQSW